MNLHSKEEVMDYVWSYSRFYYYCLEQCEDLYREKMGFPCVMVLFNCLENISKSVANDYDSKFYDVICKLYEKNLITKKEYEFLNEGNFCMRKIRNLYAHKNIATIYFQNNDEREFLWPLTENETSLMIYSKISDIIFNLMIKIISCEFIGSAKNKFQYPLDDAIDKYDLKYKILTVEKMLELKGYPKSYISSDLDISAEAKIRLIDNSSDVNVYTALFASMVDKKENEKKK